MVTGNDILGYQGNVALGLNSDGISQYGDTDTKDLSNSVFNLAYLNMQKNKEVWAQKIKDRNDAMEKISSGELEINDVLPQDRDKLMNMVGDVKKVYFDNGGDIKSDPKVWLDVNSKLATFKSANTVAKSRLLEYTKGMQEAAKETNPIRKQKMISHYNDEIKKGIDQPVLPYQQQMDWDDKVVFPAMDLEDIIPKRVGYNDVSVVKTDIPKSYMRYINRYQYDDKGETAPNIDAFYDNYFGIDGLKSPDAVYGSTNLVNEKLKRIAELNGYDVNDISKLPDYLKPIQVGPDPVTGKLQTTDRKEVAAFKIALALKYEKSMKSTLNPLYAKLDLQRAQMGKYSAEAEASKALASQRRSQVGVNQAKTRYWDSKASDGENSQNVANVFDDVIARAKNTTFINKTNGKETSREDKNVVWFHDLPSGFTKVLAGVNKKGEPIELKPKKTATGAEYYDVVKSDFFISPNGNRYSPAEIKRAFQNQTQYATQEDFIKYLQTPAKEGGAGWAQDNELVGENGRGTAQSTIQALRALNNKLRGGKTDEVLSQANDNEGDNSSNSQDNQQQDNQPE